MSDLKMHKFKSSGEITNVLLVISLFTLLMHLFTNIFAGYGIFRDELYYLACSYRPAAGYVDHPPFSIYMLMLSRTLFGESIFAIRLFPAIAASLTVYLTGLMTYKMGGKFFAVLTACTAMTFAPIFIAMNSVYSMNTFDYLLWTLAMYLLVNALLNEKPKLWYLLGAVMGIGLLNKTGFLWFGAGLFAGLLITKRRMFLQRELYISGIIALVIFSPYVIWNLVNSFPHLEFISNATKYKYSGISRMDFITGQVLLLNPFSLLVWLPGLFFFFTKAGKTFRILGIIYLTAFLILLVNGNSKPEYLGTAYAALFAGGGIFIERYFADKKFSSIKFAIPVLIGLSGFVFIPLVLPVLPVESFIEYQEALGVGAKNYESKETSALPQFYADMFGWEEMARTVSEAYTGLSEEEKKNTVVLAQNYGEAGAIEYYRSKYPLPKVISPHNNYWYWISEVDFEIKNVFVIGGEKEDHLKSCESVEAVSVISHKYSMPYESNLRLFLCRGLKGDLNKIWRAEKKFI
jgi:hypothetical protein